MTADVEPAADDGESADDATSASRGLRRLVVAMLLVVVLVGLVGWGLQERDRGDEAVASAERQRSAAIAAGSFVEALLTYDFSDLEAQRAAVAALATARFEDEYRTAFTDELQSAIEGEEATSRATVRDVFITQDTPERVRAVVAADSEVVSAAGATAKLESYLLVTLHLVDGSWLVDEMTSLGTRDAEAAQEGG